MYNVFWTMDDFINAVDNKNELMLNFLKQHKGQRIGGICGCVHLYAMGIYLIEQPEVKRIYVYEFNGEQYVLARQVAEVINYNMNSISKMMKMVSEPGKMKIKCRIENDYRYLDRWFLSLHGLIELLTRSTKIEAKQCLEVVEGGYYTMHQFCMDYLNRLSNK